MRLTLSLCTFLFLWGIVVQAHAFTDVFNHSSSYVAIEYLENLGVIQGYSDGTFRPNQTINRAEFLKILIEAKNSPYPEGGGMYPWRERKCKVNIDEAGRKKLQDIEFGSWYSGYVCYATYNEIVDGYPDGTFRPDNTINFVEAAKIVANVFELDSRFEMITDSETEFPWFTQYVSALEDKNAIPLSITSFDQQISRGEMAEIIYRIKVPGEYHSQTYDDLAGK